MLAQRYRKNMLKYNKNTIIISKSTEISLDRQASSASDADETCQSSERNIRRVNYNYIRFLDL